MNDHFIRQIEALRHDKKNPNPWLAMYLDSSIAFDKEAKAALVTTMKSPSRQYLLPLVRPLARLSMVLIQVFRIFVPRMLAASKFLHKSIAWGMKTFVSPEANFLILRHFHLGSEILEFIAKNVPGAKMTLNPLRPRTIDDLADEVFLKHDLNLYNFVIDLNQQMSDKGLTLKPRPRPDLSAITDEDIELAALPDTWHNFIDIQTAIEIYTPLFQLFLSDDDFWRSSNSLQFDETVGIYVSRLVGMKDHLWLVNNKHPMIPLTTLRAGFRLVLHGLSTECLHALLREGKRKLKGRAPMKKLK
jgi:hypothetical protein